MNLRKLHISKKQLEDLYVNKNLSMLKIAKKFSVSRITIRNYLLKYKIPIKLKNGNYGVEFHLDDSFFNKWSHKMAWLLGYISADGCVRPKKYELKLKSIDYDLLKYVKALLKTNYEIKPEKNTNCYTLCIYSKNLVESLENLGVSERKTFTILPPCVPDSFFWDYLAGLIDGDGHIKPPKDNSKQVFVSLLGNRNFIPLIASRISKLTNYAEKTPYKKGKIFDLTYSGDEATQIITKTHVNSNHFRLPRKKAVAIAAVKNRLNIIDSI